MKGAWPPRVAVKGTRGPEGRWKAKGRSVAYSLSHSFGLSAEGALGQEPKARNTQLVRPRFLLDPASPSRLGCDGKNNNRTRRRESTPPVTFSPHFLSRSLTAGS